MSMTGEHCTCNPIMPPGRHERNMPCPIHGIYPAPPEAASEERATAEEITDRHNALVYAHKHLKTHMEWRAYLKAGGELPAEEVGDLAHHEQAIAELNVICRVLRHAQRKAKP